MKRIGLLLSLIFIVVVAVILKKANTGSQPNLTISSQMQLAPNIKLLSGFRSHFEDICFIDENRGWGVTQSSLWKTEDGGKTWVEGKKAALMEGFAMPTRGVMFKVQFLTPEVGWLLETNKLLSTTDGGITWQKYEQTGIALRSFRFFDLDTGWFVGEQIADHLSDETYGRHPVIGMTTDRGKHWEIVYRGEDAPYPLEDIYPISPQNIWAVGESILHSEDGGKHWKEINTIEHAGGVPIKVRFVNPEVGWIQNRDGFGRYLLTLDGGKTWKLQPTTTKPNGFLDVAYISAKEAWGIAEENHIKTLYKTEDGGESWEKVMSGDYSLIYFLKDKRIIFFAD